MLTEKQQKALDKAKASKALTMGTSVFTTGTKFIITGYTYESVEDSDNFYPVFKTSLGDSATLSVASLLRAKAIKPYVDKKTGGTISVRTPEGSFHDELRAVLAQHRGKSADEILPILVEAFKDRLIRVRLREYVTVETPYGDRAKPLCHLEFVKD